MHSCSMPAIRGEEGGVVKVEGGRNSTVPTGVGTVTLRILSASWTRLTVSSVDAKTTLDEIAPIIKHCP